MDQKSGKQNSRNHLIKLAKRKKNFIKMQLKKSLEQPPGGITFALQGSRKKKIKREAENLFREIMAENIHSLEEATDIHVQKAQRISSKRNPTRSTSRHARHFFK